MNKRKRGIVLLLIAMLVLLTGTTVSAKGIASHGTKKFVSTNRITKKTLDSMNLQKVDKLMIVAHPDDEMLWGGMHLIKDNYLVVCLTNGNTRRYGTRRAKELQAVLAKTRDKGIILNYPDYNRSGQVDDWSSYTKAIKKDLTVLLKYKKWTEVVTHNKQGEYGHKQHKKTNRLVTECFQEVKPEGATLMYFGKYHRGTYKGKTSYTKAEIRKKANILKLYKSQAKSVKKLSHMNPYENWTVAK